MNVGPPGRRPRGTRDSGFTLVETLIAILVVTAGLLVLAQLVGVAIHHNSRARSGSIAIAVAQGQLEMLRAQYYRELHTGVAESDLTIGSHVAPPLQVGTRFFRVSWDVTLGSANRKTIELTALEVHVSGTGESATVIEDPLMRQTKSVRIVSQFAP